MAEKTITQYVDDIDGTPDPAYPNTAFALDGVEYEIDLSEGNRERLVTALREFVSNARRVGGRRKTVVPIDSNRRQPATLDAEQSRHMREWAKGHAAERGWTVSDRGRLSDKIVTAYHEAHAKPKAAKVNGRSKRPAGAKAVA